MDFEEAGRLVYSFGMSVTGLITAMGMQTENQQRVIQGESVAYGEAAFQKLIEDYSLGHNGILTAIYGR